MVHARISYVKSLTIITQSLNPYRYSANDPVNNKDASGFLSEKECDELRFRAFWERNRCSAKCGNEYNAKIASYEAEIGKINEAIRHAKQALASNIALCIASGGAGSALSKFGVHELLRWGVWYELPSSYIYLESAVGASVSPLWTAVVIGIWAVATIACILSAIKSYQQAKDDLEQSKSFWYCMIRNAAVERSNCIRKCQITYCKKLVPDCAVICYESDFQNQVQQDIKPMIATIYNAKPCCIIPNITKAEDCVSEAGGPYSTKQRKATWGIFPSPWEDPSWPGDLDYWWDQFWNWIWGNFGPEL